MLQDIQTDSIQGTAGSNTRNTGGGYRQALDQRLAFSPKTEPTPTGQNGASGPQRTGGHLEQQRDSTQAPTGAEGKDGRSERARGAIKEEPGSAAQPPPGFAQPVGPPDADMATCRQKRDQTSAFGKDDKDM